MLLLMTSRALSCCCSGRHCVSLACVYLGHVASVDLVCLTNLAASALQFLVQYFNEFGTFILLLAK